MPSARRSRRSAAKSTAIFSLGGHVARVVLDGRQGGGRERAAKAGADPGSVKIVEIEEVPLAYLPGNATRIRVKAVGDLVMA